MEFIRANEVSIDQLEDFLEQNDAVDSKKLIQSGYVVFHNNLIIGSFVLETVDAFTSYWLQQLYMVREEAAKLPVLLESIIQLAREKDVKRMYVHSHQPGVDVLLEALQFTQQTKRDLIFQKQRPTGNWWTYLVS